ncbi:MAG: hypothetical protein PW792_15020 [Acidobacteriaceae bacterium]|nr:hypothetical protein [Acidobacteriaceae bacterium]
MKLTRYVFAAALILAPAVASAKPVIIAAHPTTVTIHDRSPKPHTIHDISAHR